MILKNAFMKQFCTAALCTGLLAWAGLSLAAEYRPGEFLGLDLPRAVLSPKPLGPPAQFAPVPIEAFSGSPVAQAATGHKPLAGTIARSNKVAERTGAARTRLARRPGNPMDAQASDRRIQVWPCNTGGICNWQH